MCDNDYAQRLEDGFLMMAEDAEPVSLDEAIAYLDDAGDDGFLDMRIGRAAMIEAIVDRDPDVHREFARPCRNKRLV